MPKWKQIAKPDPQGHRFFELTAAPADARIFIADDSGNDPDTCDDRRMYLNRLGRIQATLDGHFIVPCSDENGNATSTLASFTEMVYLCTVHGMDLAHKGGVYRLTKVV